MAHLTTPFPFTFSVSSAGGPMYRNTLVAAYSGVVEVNEEWTYAQHVYPVRLTNKTETDLETFADFFHAAKGRANTFNVTDPREYKSCARSSTVASSDQTLITATGSGTTSVQIIKNYTAGGVTRQRKITRPKSGTLVVAKKASATGSPTTLTSGAGDYTVDYDTGEITLATGLVTGEIITAGYEFYVPCRLGSDRLDTIITTANCDAGIIGSITVDLIEEKE